MKIHGRVCALEDVVVAPLSGRSCVAFDVHVEQLKRETWTTASRDRAACEFAVEDATGRALVRMRLSRVHLVNDATTQDEVLGPLTEATADYLRARGHEPGRSLRPIRVSEGILEEGESVLVMGIGRWEHDPDPEGAGSYRERKRRFVLEGDTAFPLQLTDDPLAS